MKTETYLFHSLTHTHTIVNDETATDHEAQESHTSDFIRTLPYTTGCTALDALVGNWYRSIIGTVRYFTKCTYCHYSVLSGTTTGTLFLLMVAVHTIHHTVGKMLDIK